MNFNKLLDVVGVVGVVTGQPEITAVSRVIQSMIKDEVDNKEFLKGLSDDEIRQLMYSCKEELYDRVVGGGKK